MGQTLSRDSLSSSGPGTRTQASTDANIIPCESSQRGDGRGSASEDRNGQEVGHRRSKEPSTRGKGLNPKERTGESRDKGLKTNGNQKTSTRGEQSWRLATRGRFRAKGYVCCKRQPSQNLSRNLFPPRRFSPPGDSAAFNGTARQPSHLGLGMHHPVAGATPRCPVLPSTPVGPDQVNEFKFI
jgi:hypothetical protein